MVLLLQVLQHSSQSGPFKTWLAELSKGSLICLSEKQRSPRNGEQGLTGSGAFTCLTSPPACLPACSPPQCASDLWLLLMASALASSAENTLPRMAPGLPSPPALSANTPSPEAAGTLCLTSPSRLHPSSPALPPCTLLSLFCPQHLQPFSKLDAFSRLLDVFSYCLAGSLVHSLTAGKLA